MKKRTRVALAAGCLAALSGLAVATYFTRRSDVTTRSAAAREAYVEAEKDMERFYWSDAKTHLARALELDPEFPLALLSLAELEAKQGKEERAKSYVLKAHQQVDRVTPTERYRIEIAAAQTTGKSKDVHRLVDEYFSNYPRDPWILQFVAGRTLRDGKVEEADALYERILKISPDSCAAYNQLGYSAARRGDFARAEQHFKKYAFIAGRQANPYDSLGELYLNTGRYDEAEDSLRKALEIKPDFVTSTIDLALVRRKQGRTNEAIGILEDVALHSEQFEYRRQAQALLGILLLEEGRAREASVAFDELLRPPLSARSGRTSSFGPMILKGLALVQEGDLPGAEKLDAEVVAALEKASQEVDREREPYFDLTADSVRQSLRSLRAHVALARGEFAVALEQIQGVKNPETGLPFGTEYLGFIRLFRLRVVEARALVGLGRTGEAAVALAKNLAIDPRDRMTLEELRKTQGSAEAPR